MITENEIRERIRKEKHFNVHQYRIKMGMSRDEYQEYNRIINSMIRGGLKLADIDEYMGITYRPETIIAYTNENGELCLRFRTQQEFGRHRTIKTPTSESW